MRPCPSASRGVTVTELMVALSVTAILAAVAVPNLGWLAKNQRIASVSSELYLSLARARSEAVKRNGDVSVVPVDGDWTHGWSVLSVDSSVPVERHDPLSNLTVSGPASIVFNSSGRVRSPASPAIQLSASGASAIRCVKLDLSGHPVTVKATCS